MPTDAAMRAAKEIAEMDARIGGRDWHWHYVQTAAEIIDRETRRQPICCKCPEKATVRYIGWQMPPEEYYFCDAHKLPVIHDASR